VFSAIAELSASCRDLMQPKLTRCFGSTNKCLLPGSYPYSLPCVWFQLRVGRARKVPRAIEGRKLHQLCYYQSKKQVAPGQVKAPSSR
jgi:hypothetical protein